MAYIPPTVSEFKARFPDFSAVDDALVQSALDEAAAYVDDTWLSEDQFKMGRMLYAAHVLTLDGHGVGTEAQSRDLTGVRSYRSGNFSVDRSGAANASAQDVGTLKSTSYGRRFISLRRLSVPPITVV